MTTLSRPSAVPPDQGLRALTECLIALAGTPDDSSWIEPELVGIAQLTAELVMPDGWASITAYRGAGYCTAATSSDMALAADTAQYAADAGPGIAALESGMPVSVPDIATLTTWPTFRAAAAESDVRAMLSIPLFAGRGTPIAALNIYCRDADVLAPLTAAVLDAHGCADAAPADHRPVDGPAQLAAGLRGAFAVRTVIQQAVGVLATEHRTVDGAYLILRLRAAETGLTLVDTAAAVIAEQQW